MTKPETDMRHLDRTYMDILADNARLTMKQTREKLNALLAKHEIAKNQVSEEKANLVRIDEKLYAAKEAQLLLQNVAEAIQQEAHKRISSIVTRCLRSVFDRPYTFDIQFEQKRGRTEAILSFVRDGMSIDPMSSSGGGVIDVAAFALRLSCMMLLRPPVRRLLVLDEPWKHLSEQYRPMMRELVETLAEELNVQFIIVTHSDEFRIGKVVEI